MRLKPAPPSFYEQRQKLQQQLCAVSRELARSSMVGIATSLARQHSEVAPAGAARPKGCASSLKTHAEPSNPPTLFAEGMSKDAFLQHLWRHGVAPPPLSSGTPPAEGGDKEVRPTTGPSSSKPVPPTLGCRLGRRLDTAAVSYVPCAAYPNTSLIQIQQAHRRRIYEEAQEVAFRTLFAAPSASSH